MYEMKEAFWTGIALIDTEHEQLFTYANDIYEILNDEFAIDKYDNIRNILNLLRDYTKKHFADEEAYMESIGYKKIFTQKMQHQQFITKLDELDLEDWDTNDMQQEVILDILNFVTSWLISHILELDTQIGK